MAAGYSDRGQLARRPSGCERFGRVRATLSTIDWTLNSRDPDWRCAPPPPDVVAFHRSLPDYRPTPLVDSPAIARALTVGRVLIKDESMRLGLPAFKALGASWAMHRLLAARPAEGPLTFVTATDGNHGRAVARMARLMGHRAVVYVPTGIPARSIAAIEGEGAPVTVVDGSYDHAVAAAANLAGHSDAVLLQDTAWPGYEDVPAWVVEGYETLFAEIDDQLGELGLDTADVIAVPVGVGSLAQAAVAHYRSRDDRASVRLLSVEPTAAACVLESLRAGRAVSVPPGQTIMAGLNCPTPSSIAWPPLAGGLDAAVAIDDDDARAAGHLLDESGVHAGPSGWASLAGTVALLSGEGADARRAALGIDEGSIVVVLATEAAHPLAA